MTEFKIGINTDNEDTILQEIASKYNTTVSIIREVKTNKRYIIFEIGDMKIETLIDNAEIFLRNTLKS